MKLVRYHSVVLPSEVKNSFAKLADHMFSTIGVAVEPVDGLKLSGDVVAELLTRVKNPIKSELSAYDYIKSLDPRDFEPPISGNRKALRDPSGEELVFSIPNLPDFDPRISGRIVQFGPKNIINPTVLKYLVYNAGSFGFIHYGPADPSIWYWRGDKDPKTYTPTQVVSTFSNELSYLL